MESCFVSNLVFECPKYVYISKQAYTRSMKFDSKPDIPYLRKLFRDLYHAQGCASVGKLWDWDHIDTDLMTVGATDVPTAGPNPLEAVGGGGVKAPLRPATAAAVMAGDDMEGDDGNGSVGDGNDDYAGRPVKVNSPTLLLKRATSLSYSSFHITSPHHFRTPP